MLVINSFITKCYAINEQELLKTSTWKNTYNIGSGTGPAAPVLAGPLFLLVSFVNGYRVNTRVYRLNWGEDHVETT